MSETLNGRKPIDIVIGILQSRGYEPQEAGPGSWRSRCPVHKGRSANMSVKETSDGTVLIHCHHASEGVQTCSASAIARELGLNLRDLFPRKAPMQAKRKDGIGGRAFSSAELAVASLEKRLGKPVAPPWIYDEPDGDLPLEVMRVYRFAPPGEGKQFRPIHLSQDGWHLGDPPGKLPLYNLPKLATAETVVVLEGEKCADLVSMLGLVSTTSSHGAQSPQKTDWRPLAGKQVVIVPDNDPPGEMYAQSVAGLLSGLDPAPRVRILKLPLNEKGHDVQQWLDEVVPDTWDFTDCRIELERLWADLPHWAPPPGTGSPAKVNYDAEGPPRLTEWGNARRIVAAHGHRIRYCYPKSLWLAWDGVRWAADETGDIWRIAKQLPRQILKEASSSWDDDFREKAAKWSERSEQKRVIEAAIKLAWSETGIGCMPDDFDRDPWLLNCPNGVVDLLTGELRAQKAEDMLSKMTAVAYDPQHECPRWKSVLNEIFDRDQELISYFQRAAGYSLTGDVTEHALFLCYGTGRNGKNTILDLIRDLMGDYATVVDPKMFLASTTPEHPAAVADLVGRRFVMTSEIEEGQQLAEAQIKRLTGDRRIKARFMQQNWFEFQVHFKIWLLANSRPEVHGQDEGIWSRIRMLPFSVYIPEEKRIKGLGEMLLKEEGPGILAWLVDGCREWHRLTLAEPPKVVEAVRDYRFDQDVIGTFLATSCKTFLANDQLRDQARVKAISLYTRYMDWCKQRGEKALTERKFGGEMTRRGFCLKASNNVYYRHGITLVDDDAPGEQDRDFR
jgi:putative DNA primase/helicase